MAENTQPPIAGEVQQSLEIPQSGQAEGNVNQGSSQGLPPPVPPVPNHPPPTTYQQQGGNENHSGLNIARFIVEILTLLVLFWYTIITNGLWRVADQTNRLNIENSRLDQRAWVTVESIATHPAVPEVGQTYRISVNFRNSGKTPAKDVFTTTVVNPVTMPGKPNFSYGNDPTARVGMIAPNGTNFASLSPAKSRRTGKDAPLTPEVLADLKEDRLRFYVHGRVAYADIFGECHWIIFCSYLLASDLSSFGICPDHNDAGDEECKENPR